MRNIQYNTIANNNNEISTQLDAHSKQSQGKNYFLIELAPTELSTIDFDSPQGKFRFKLTNSHLSIYESQSSREGVLSAYHFTAQLENANDDTKYKLHVYFDRWGNLACGPTIKNTVTEQYLQIPKKAERKLQNIAVLAIRNKISIIEQHRRYLLEQLDSQLVPEHEKLMAYSKQLPQNVELYVEQLRLLINIEEQIVRFRPDKHPVSRLQLLQNSLNYYTELSKQPQVAGDKEYSVDDEQEVIQEDPSELDGNISYIECFLSFITKISNKSLHKQATLALEVFKSSIEAIEKDRDLNLQTKLRALGARLCQNLLKQNETELVKQYGLYQFINDVPVDLIRFAIDDNNHDLLIAIFDNMQIDMDMNLIDGKSLLRLALERKNILFFSSLLKLNPEMIFACDGDTSIFHEVVNNIYLNDFMEPILEHCDHLIDQDNLYFIRDKFTEQMSCFPDFMQTPTRTLGAEAGVSYGISDSVTSLITAAHQVQDDTNSSEIKSIAPERRKRLTNIYNNVTSDVRDENFVDSIYHQAEQVSRDMDDDALNYVVMHSSRMLEIRCLVYNRGKFLEFLKLCDIRYSNDHYDSTAGTDRGISGTSISNNIIINEVNGKSILRTANKIRELRQQGKYKGAKKMRDALFRLKEICKEAHGLDLSKIFATEWSTFRKLALSARNPTRNRSATALLNTTALRASSSQSLGTSSADNSTKKRRRKKKR